MAAWVQRSIFEGDQSGIGVQKQLVTLSAILRDVDPVLFNHLGREEGLGLGLDSVGGQWISSSALVLLGMQRRWGQAASFLRCDRS